MRHTKNSFKKLSPLIHTFGCQVQTEIPVYSFLLHPYLFQVTQSKIPGLSPMPIRPELEVKLYKNVEVQSQGTRSVGTQ